MTEGRRPSTVTLRIPARADYVVFSRLVVTGLSRTVEMDSETLADLKLAVSEACAYTVRRAEAEETVEDIAVSYELGPGYVAVEVVSGDDSGGPLPDEAEQWQDMGLAVIRAVVDEFALDAAPSGGLRLAFRKSLPR
jgi:anti-sigma regulatory factor (Ser/Thr protein kinase)